MLVFGRRVQNNVYAKADGQPGAAGWALDNMRGQWRVTQAVAGTTQLDVVHRVIGRPGVVLVAEGASHRTKNLLAQEKKKVSRVAGQVPIYEFTVGNEEGDVPLSKLQRHMTKLPRNIDKRPDGDAGEAPGGHRGARRAGDAQGPDAQGRGDEGHAAHRPQALATRAGGRWCTTRNER